MDDKAADVTPPHAVIPRGCDDEFTFKPMLSEENELKLCCVFKDGSRQSQVLGFSVLFIDTLVQCCTSLRSIKPRPSQALYLNTKSTQGSPLRSYCNIIRTAITSSYHTPFRLLYSETLIYIPGQGDTKRS